jgi:hypothetical protein
MFPPVANGRTDLVPSYLAAGNSAHVTAKIF